MSCGAPYGLPGPDPVNVRNGYRHRDFDARAGRLDVAIPKLRSDSYFPDWLLERRRRAEAGLTSEQRPESAFQGQPLPLMQRVNEWKAISVTRGEILAALHRFMTRISAIPFAFRGSRLRG